MSRQIDENFIERTMVIKKMLKILLMCLIISFSITSFAQSKHAALWNFGDFCLDFNTNPVSMHELTGSCNHAKWYVDQNGKKVLELNVNGLFDNDDNLILPYTTEEKNSAFFPVPMDDNSVFFFTTKFIR